MLAHNFENDQVIYKAYYENKYFSESVFASYTLVATLSTDSPNDYFHISKKEAYLATLWFVSFRSLLLTPHPGG